MKTVWKIATVHDDKLRSIALEAGELEHNAVSITVNINDEKYTVIHVPMTDSDITVNLSIQLPAFESCVLACVVGATIGDVLECRRMSNSANEFIDCLARKGHKFVDNVTSCLGGCLTVI